MTSLHDLCGFVYGESTKGMADLYESIVPLSVLCEEVSTITSKAYVFQEGIVMDAFRTIGAEMSEWSLDAFRR